jgi:hypothetical protein
MADYSKIIAEADGDLPFGDCVSADINYRKELVIEYITTDCRTEIESRKLATVDREDTAKMAVSKMHNVDGTVGGHWSMEDTDKIAAAHGIAHKCDFYYAMNMLYSDLAEAVTKDATAIAKMAKALYFDDPDMVDGKLFRQWMAVAFVKK